MSVDPPSQKGEVSRVELAQPPKSGRQVISFYGGFFQAIWILLLGFFNYFVSPLENLWFSFAGLASFHIALLLFFVFGRRSSVVVGAFLAGFVILAIDSVFFWHFWNTPGAVHDYWKIAFWWTLKSLPVMCVFFFWLWVRGVERLSRVQDKKEV